VHEHAGYNSDSCEGEYDGGDDEDEDEEDSGTHSHQSDSTPVPDLLSEAGSSSVPSLVSDGGDDTGKVDTNHEGTPGLIGDTDDDDDEGPPDLVSSHSESDHEANGRTARASVGKPTASTKAGGFNYTKAVQVCTC
jgi:hypothetical protein